VTWVYTFPQWLLFIMVVSGMGLIAGLGLAVYRKIVPQSDDVSHNDVAGPIISTVGTILAVILSFMLVSVWQQYDQAGGTVVQEASAVADLYHAAANFPEPTQSNLRAALRTYTNAIIGSEWPAMRYGHVSASAAKASFGVLGIIIHYEPKTNAQQALQQDAIGFVNTFVDARRDRLFDNQSGVPMIFWIGMLILAGVTIGCAYIFRIQNEVMHVFMCVALAAVIGVVFVLIAEFDYPFRGDAQIAPTAWQALQATIEGTPDPLTVSN
jgi:Protein of unknown function (DUF4239)